MMQSLSIYYATMTGNTESLARRLGERAASEDWTPHVIDLAKVRPPELVGRKFALFIVSTWGEGEPPADATEFWYALEKAPLDLAGMRYAVLGLGDRDYSEYNAFARQLDARLAAMGAQSLGERCEADVDFEDTYVNWENQMIAVLDEARRSLVPAS